MNNKDNKKSARHWAERLFKQSSASNTVPQNKTYYAQRYLEEHDEPGRSSLSALFSEVGKEHTNLEFDTANFQWFFEQQPPITKVDTVSIEPDQFPYANLSQASGDKLDLASGASLNGQFTVLNCFDETPDTKTFRLGMPNGRTFDYFPGQYITLSIVISGHEYKRSYSLASSPTRSKILEITVKRAPDGGIVSNWLNDHLKIGDTVNLKGPFGKFSCINHTHEKILFLAAGSGIVPIMSMLRWLTDTETHVDIKLLLSFRAPDDIIYWDELNLITARHKNINMAIILTTDTIVCCQWSGLTGRINEQMINEQVPDLQERTVYLCGPDAFMAECKKNMLKLKLPAERLFCESFTVNSPSNKPQDSGYSLSERCKTGSYRISFVRTGKTFITNGQMTLLDIAIKYGIAIAHECRNGTCGECMIKCLKGKVEMTDQAEIDDLDKKKGWVYACCAYPASNVLLDI